MSESEPPMAKKLKKDTKLKLEAILPPKYRSDNLETIPYTAVVVTDKKKISKFMLICSKQFPLPVEHGHLKRVKANSDGTVTILVATSIEFDRSLFDTPLEVTRVAVPVHCPLTRAQYDAERTIWPLKFTANGHLESRLNGTAFSDGQMDDIRRDVLTLRALYADADNACLIVDPNRALTHGDRTVAQSSSPKTPNRYRPLDHAVMLSIAALSKRLLDNSDLGQQYLCTGYHCYVFREPCLMCAMALVHSRVHTVFYVASDESNGALGSKCLLHSNPSLNHNFEVYQIKDEQ